MKDTSSFLRNRFAEVKRATGAFAVAIAAAVVFGFVFAVLVSVAVANERVNLFAVSVAVGVGFAVGFAVTFVVMVASKIDIFVDFLIGIIDLIEKIQTKELQLSTSPRYKLLKLSHLVFSAKTQKEVFLPAMAEWDEEIFEALKKDKDAKLFMINLRNTCGFIIAMWQKSPLGDLLEYVRKIAS
jgi:hypothetical protein